MSDALLAYVFVLTTFFISALYCSLKRKWSCLSLYNLLLFLTYSVKPFLSCDEKYVVYNGCYASNDVLALLAYPVLIFFSCQCFLFYAVRNSDSRVSNNQSLVGPSFFVYAILSAMGLYRWYGIGSFEDFTAQRLAIAADSGIVSFFWDTFVLLLIASSSYKERYFNALMVGILSFLATGQKVFLFLPILLSIFEIYQANKLSAARLAAYSLLFFGLLICAQYIRGDGGGLDLDLALLLIAIPFDAFDNAVQILTQFASANSVTSFLIPLDYEYPVEIILQIIPKTIYSAKASVIGFWRIQSDYLPGLFTGTDSMSVAISFPVDYYLSLGAVLLVPVTLLFVYILSRLSINTVGFQRFLCISMLMFSIEFTRGGFRLASNLVIQLMLGFLVFKAISLFYKSQKSTNIFVRSRKSQFDAADSG